MRGEDGSSVPRMICTTMIFAVTHEGISATSALTAEEIKALCHIAFFLLKPFFESIVDKFIGTILKGLQEGQFVHY